MAYLSESNLPFKLYEHEAVMNLEEMAQKLKLEKAPLIKNLFYVDKKPNSYFLVIARQDTKLDKGFWKKLGTTGGNVRFAKEEQMESVLKSAKGSINPFSLANDEKQQVKVAIDEHLFENEYWAFHPIENTATVEMLRNDFLKFLEQEKIAFHRLELDTPVEKAEEGKKDQKKEEETKEVPKENTIGIDVKKS